MLVSIDVKYQGRKEARDSTSNQVKLENDGPSNSARICEKILVTDRDCAARMGNALAAGYRKQYKQQYCLSTRDFYTSVSIVIRNFSNGNIIVECWDGATQFHEAE